MFVGRASRREATFTVTAEYIQALHKRPRNSATFQIEVTKLNVAALSNVSVFESDFHFFGWNECRWNDISLIKVKMKLWVASHSSKQIDASIRIIDFTQVWKISVSIYTLFFMKYFLTNTLDVFLLQVESCLWCFLTHFWERGRKCIAWWFPRGTPPLLYLRPLYLAILQ